MTRRMMTARLLAKLHELGEATANELVFQANLRSGSAAAREILAGLVDDLVLTTRRVPSLGHNGFSVLYSVRQSRDDHITQ